MGLESKAQAPLSSITDLALEELKLQLGITWMSISFPRSFFDFWFPASLLFSFSPLLCFSGFPCWPASLLFCGFLLFWFSASLLLCFFDFLLFCFIASLLLCFSLLLLFRAFPSFFLAFPCFSLLFPCFFLAFACFFPAFSLFFPAFLLFQLLCLLLPCFSAFLKSVSSSVLFHAFLWFLILQISPKTHHKERKHTETLKTNLKPILNRS